MATEGNTQSNEEIEGKTQRKRDRWRHGVGHTERVSDHGGGKREKERDGGGQAVGKRTIRKQKGKDTGRQREWKTEKKRKSDKMQNGTRRRDGED
jgi:hypothetical protein